MGRLLMLKSKGARDLGCWGLLVTVDALCIIHLILDSTGPRLSRRVAERGKAISLHCTSSVIYTNIQRDEEVFIGGLVLLRERVYAY